MRFINLRGTSGSGKTTIVRKLIGGLIHLESITKEGRKRPAYNIYEDPLGVGSVAIMGHYETACGGCDTINKLDEVVEYTNEAFYEYGVNYVIAEGLLLGKDVKRVPLLPDPHVLYIDTPLEDCLQGIKSRRAERISGGHIEYIYTDEEIEKINKKPKAMEPDSKSIRSAVHRLPDNVKVIEINRENGFETLLNLIK